MPLPAAIAGVKLADAAGKATKVLDFPVVGIRRKVTRRTKTRTTETDYSIQLRGWEVFLGLMGAGVMYYMYRGGFGNGTTAVTPQYPGTVGPVNPAQINPLDPFGITGPVGQFAWSLSPGGALQELMKVWGKKDAP